MICYIVALFIILSLFFFLQDNFYFNFSRSGFAFKYFTNCKQCRPNLSDLNIENEKKDEQESLQVIVYTFGFCTVLIIVNCYLYF